MCETCDRLAKEKLAKTGKETKSDEWKDVVKRNPGDGYGTREMARQVDMGMMDDQFGYDDLEIDEEGIADLIMDENAMATMARPGTSFRSPLNSASQPGGIS